MKIELGKIEDLIICRQCVENSILGDIYFADDAHTNNSLKEGFQKEEIYLAKSLFDEYVGFMRIDLLGAFARFPLLRVIAVREMYRNQGFGSQMLRFYENMAFENSDKVFLLVSEFNAEAKRLYHRMGYSEVGRIPDLYKEGIAEYLLMKKR